MVSIFSHFRFNFNSTADENNRTDIHGCGEEVFITEIGKRCLFIVQSSLGGNIMNVRRRKRQYGIVP